MTLQFQDEGRVGGQAHLSGVGDSQAVQGPHSYMDDLLPSQALDHLRLAHVDVRAVAQPEVIALPPDPAQINESLTTIWLNFRYDREVHSFVPIAG